MRRFFLMGFALCALMLASCSSSIKMTSSWNNTNDTKNAPAVKRILVVGLFGEKSRDLRQQTEEQMAANLSKLGYTAFTSFKEYGPKTFVNISEDQVMHIIDSSYAGAYDGVIIVSIVDKNSTKSYVPGYYSPYPYYGYYRPFYSPFYTSYSPGYYKTDMHYSFEANFYDLNNKKMLYSGQSQVVDPGKPNAFAIDYSRVILRDMRKKNVLS